MKEPADSPQTSAEERRRATPGAKKAEETYRKGWLLGMDKPADSPEAT